MWNGNGFSKNGKIEFKIEDGRGSIKKYNKNDELEFEGDYLNGRINGKGKEYYEIGKLL